MATRSDCLFLLQRKADGTLNVYGRVRGDVFQDQVQELYKQRNSKKWLNIFLILELLGVWLLVVRKIFLLGHNIYL
jgi:hypothetical protein